LIIRLINEYRQLRGHWNWYEITLVKVDFDIDKVMGCATFSFVVLGLGFYVAWTWGNADEHLIASVKEAVELLGEPKDVS